MRECDNIIPVFLFLQEIEDMISEKIIEIISSRSEIGELRSQCDSYRVYYFFEA